MITRYWYVDDSSETKNLQQIEKFGTQDTEFKSAQKLTIQHIGCWINESNTFLNDKDDILVATRVRVGNKIHTDRIHFYKKNQHVPDWISTAMYPAIFATKDFNPSEMSEFVIQIKVFDEDGLSDTQREEIQKYAGTTAKAASATFPVLAPYSFLVGPIVNIAMELLDNLDEHDPIINRELWLFANKGEEQGYGILQPGRFVIFENKLDASNLILNGNEVMDSNGVPFKGSSYSVIRISRDYNVGKQYEIDAHEAKLLTEFMQGKKVNSNILKDEADKIITHSIKLSELSRYTELKAKAIRSTDEETLFNDLHSTLSKYEPIAQYI